MSKKPKTTIVPVQEDSLMWQASDQRGVTAECTHNNGTGRFTVTVRVAGQPNLTKTESFQQSFTPTFGMDVQDHAQSLEIAEKLAGVIDVELDINIQ